MSMTTLVNPLTPPPQHVSQNAATTGQILDGKAVSQHLLAQIQADVDHLKTHRPSGQPLPKLVVMLVGEDPASQVYTQRKATVAQNLGILSERLVFPPDTTETRLLETLHQLNIDPTVHAILIQLPLPSHINTQRVLQAIAPEKDVDGFHPLNLGKLLSGDYPTALPCTPAGIITLLKHYDLPLSGQNAVVVGRSTIVGKPMGLLLLQEDATVTFCHSRTQALAETTRQADILVSAIGQPHWITEDFVKPGAVVIDVGINRTSEGKLVGDVDFQNVQPKASWITPVPGGIGPMTIATLMTNTLKLYNHQIQTTPQN